LYIYFPYRVKTTYLSVTKGSVIKWLAFVLLMPSCIVYDPPAEGRYIRIANQTDNGIYVFLDSIPVKNKHINWVDSGNVNGHAFLFGKIIHIKAFGIEEVFVFEDYLNVPGKNKLMLYFLPDSLIQKPMINIPDSAIRKQHLNIKDIKKPSAAVAPLNIIFLHKDTIVREYEFNRVN